MAEWKIVPVWPNEEMHLAGLGVNRREQYAAMLAAAPRASENEELVARASVEIARIAMGYDTAHDYRAQARAVLKMLEE